jgi:hypothetical protein
MVNPYRELMIRIFKGCSQNKWKKRKKITKNCYEALEEEI